MCSVKVKVVTVKILFSRDVLACNLGRNLLPPGT